MASGYLRISRRNDVEMLEDSPPAAPTVDPMKVLQSLAPAEGVAAFVAIQNLIAQPAVAAPVTVWTAATVGLIVSLVVTWLGTTGKGGKPAQWVVFWFRIAAYILFAVMLAKTAGVEVLPFQHILGPAALVLFAFIAPPVIARLETL